MDSGRRCDDRGFSLLETVVAFSLLAIVILAVTSAVGTGLRLVREAKTGEIATNIAEGELERVRDRASFPYQNIGVTGGVVPGVLVAEQTRTVRGVEFTIVTDVEYVEDTTGIGGDNPDASAKLLSVSVYPTADGMENAVRMRSILTPQESTTPATVVVRVADSSDNSVATGVGIRLHRNGFDSRSGLTDTVGRLTFAGLEGTEATGVPYTIELDDVAWKTEEPAGVTASPSSLDKITKELHVYQLLTLELDVFDSTTGTQLPDPYWVALHMEPAGRFSVRQGLWSSTSASEKNASLWTISAFPNGTDVVGNMSYNFSVWAAGYRPATVSFLAPTSYPSGILQTTHAHSVGLVPAVTEALTVRVFDTSSPPAGFQALVRVQDAATGTDVLRYALTGSAGTVSLHLEPGVYQVTAIGVTSQTKTVTLTQGTPVTEDFQVAR